MYGLEKKGREKFAFDLEKEIQANPKRRKEILEQAQERIHELKSLLQKGSSEKEQDKLAILLQGYTALQKVLKKVG